MACLGIYYMALFINKNVITKMRFSTLTDENLLQFISISLNYTIK